MLGVITELMGLLFITLCFDEVLECMKIKLVIEIFSTPSNTKEMDTFIISTKISRHIIYTVINLVKNISYEYVLSPYLLYKPHTHTYIYTHTHTHTHTHTYTYNTQDVDK